MSDNKLSSSLGITGRGASLAAPLMEFICEATLSGVLVISGVGISGDKSELMRCLMEVLVRRLPSPGCLIVESLDSLLLCLLFLLSSSAVSKSSSSPGTSGSGSVELAGGICMVVEKKFLIFGWLEDEEWEEDVEGVGWEEEDVDGAGMV